ncbi:MAG: hypothetical protein ACI8W8_000864 [Rhodothermales bacterium]|jgi:hypothetical protein
MQNRSLFRTFLICGLLGNWAVAENVPSSAQLVFGPPTEIVTAKANVDPQGKPRANIGVFDYNGDGIFDSLHGGKDVSVRINTGTNQKPVCDKPISILAGGKDLPNVGCLCYGGTSPQFVDWNGDTLLDLIVSHSKGPIEVAINEGSLTKPNFQAVFQIKTSKGDLVPRQAPGSGGNLQILDWNKDGKFDLLVDQCNVVLNEGSATQPKFESYTPVLKWSPIFKKSSIRTYPVDYDKDGDWDIITHCFSYGAAGDVLYHENIGSKDESVFATPAKLKIKGYFAALQAHPPTGSSRGDTNGDGLIVWMSTQKDKSVVLKLGQTGEAKRAKEPAVTIKVDAISAIPDVAFWALSDFNLDGNADILVSDSAGVVQLLANTTSADKPAEVTFAAPTPLADTGFSAVPILQDVDSDGKRDLLCMGLKEDSILLFVNKGTDESPLFATAGVSKKDDLYDFNASNWSSISNSRPG